MIAHDVTVQIEIPPRQRVGLSRVDLFLSAASDQDNLQSSVQFRFDEQHLPQERIEHTFRLTNGDYFLVLRLTREDGTQTSSRHEMTVSGEMSLALSAR